MRWRSEGEGEGLKIRAAADGEQIRIRSEAFKVAEQHRGEGEAEAARIYSEKLEAAPDFYRFLRMLRTSRNFFDADTTLVLPADTELFGLLYDSNHYQGSKRLGSEGAPKASPNDAPEDDRPDDEMFNQGG